MFPSRPSSRSEKAGHLAGEGRDAARLTAGHGFRYTGHVRSRRALGNAGRGRRQIRGHRGAPSLHPGIPRLGIPADDDTTGCYAGQANQLLRFRGDSLIAAIAGWSVSWLARDPPPAHLLTRIGGNDRSPRAADNPWRRPRSRRARPARPAVWSPGPVWSPAMPDPGARRMGGSGGGSSRPATRGRGYLTLSGGLCRGPRAIAPASLRLVTWGFSRMCVTWTLAVFSVMNAHPAHHYERTGLPARSAPWRGRPPCDASRTTCAPPR
jgi:hypothetical protein